MSHTTHVKWVWWVIFPHKWETINLFSVFSRKCWQPSHEPHVHDREICFQLLIRGFLSIQLLDKFRYFNFDHNCICVRYEKTLIGDRMIHYFFKRHLLFCIKREQLSNDIAFHFSSFVLHSIGIFLWLWLICETFPRISVHGLCMVKFFISWKYLFFKKIGNKFFTLCLNGEGNLLQVWCILV